MHAFLNVGMVFGVKSLMAGETLLFSQVNLFPNPARLWPSIIGSCQYAADVNHVDDI